MAETDFSKSVKRGDKGKDVKLVQEWLTYHGFGTSIDGGFGPGTELAVKNFQAKMGLPSDGVVNEPTFNELVKPLILVQQPIGVGNKTLGDLVVAYARQHLKLHPIEIGGENSGPWVRYYMAGNEGKPWPWCAGFATSVLRQAARTLGVPTPHPYAFGCDFLAGVAMGNGRFLRPKNAAEIASVKPGYLFLVRKTQNAWAHIGIVEAVAPEAITTIEGNTNDSGSPEGFEVCRRSRAIKDKDFLIV